MTSSIGIIYYIWMFYWWANLETGDREDDNNLLYLKKIFVISFQKLKINIQGPII